MILFSLTRLFAALLIISFLSEMAVMYLLPIVLPGASWNIEAIADATLLTLITAPLFWWQVIHPLRGAALREKAHASAVIAHAIDGIITLNRRGTVASSNPAVEAMFGYKFDELVGQSIALLIPKLEVGGRSDLNLTDQLIRDSNQEIALSEFTGRRKDGHEFAIELSGSVVWLDGQETLIVIVRDVTERKRAEEQLQKLFRAVEQSPTTVVITDFEGRIEYVNPKFTAVTGYTAVEAIGSNPRMLNSGRQPAEFYRDLWQTILHGDEWRGEFCNRKKNGELYWEFASISPIRNSTGQVTHFVAVKEDITDRNKSEKELRQAMEAAESANRAKSQFLANMSHELRTPLNGVMGYVQILQQGPGVNNDQRQCLKSIQRCGEHLLSLINDVLDLARIESGKIEVRNGQCDLPSLLLDVHDVVLPQAVEKGLRLVFDFAPHAPQVILTDPPKLRQVLVNIVANALKFTETGSVTLRVSQPNDNEIAFQVTDTGPGIPPDRLTDIFEPFKQLEQHRKTVDGTGLGLAISRRLVAALGGRLGVTSTVGQGSCFSIILPLLEVDDVDVLTLSDDSLGDVRRRVLSPGHHLTVLIADDNAINRDLLVRLLQQTGIGTVQAANGKEVIEKLRQHHLPLVLLDAHMPDMDGLAATKAIRDDPELRETAIILVSADVLTNFQDQLGNVRYDEFIGKPLRVSELLDMIAKHTKVRFVDRHDTAAVPSPTSDWASLPASTAHNIVRRLRNAAEINSITELNALAAELFAVPGPTHQYGEAIAHLADTLDFDGVASLADSLDVEAAGGRTNR